MTSKEEPPRTPLKEMEMHSPLEVVTVSVISDPLEEKKEFSSSPTRSNEMDTKTGEFEFNSAVRPKQEDETLLSPRSPGPMERFTATFFASKSTIILPDFQIDIDNEDKVWRCNCIPDFGWNRWGFGLRYNIRNAKRFISWQLVIGNIYMFLGIYFNTIMQWYVQKRSLVFSTLPLKYNFTKEDLELFTTLPDIGFDLFDYLGIQNAWAFSLGTNLPNYMVMVGFLVTLLRFMCTPMGATIQRRWGFNLGTLFIFRGVSIVATMLPNPLQSCTTKALEYPAVEAAALILTGKIATCADVLFSGHTVNSVLAGLVWHTYSHKKGCQIFRASCDPIGALCCPGTPAENKAGRLVRATTDKYLMWTYVIATLLIIIATRFHYTIDVIIGLWMTLLLWKLHYYYIYSLYMNRDNCFDIFMQWFEKDSEEFNVEKKIAAQALDVLDKSIRIRSHRNRNDTLDSISDQDDDGVVVV